MRTKPHRKSRHNDVTKHRCELAPEGSIVMNEIRKSWRRWLVPDSKSNLTLNVLKSRTAIKAEILRHYYYFSNTIHPLSQLRYVWETIMIVVFFVFFVGTPIHVVFIYGLRKKEFSYTNFGLIEIMLDIVFIADIVLNFSTGYIAQKTDRIVLRRTKIIKHYLKGMFWVDLISSIPWTLFLPSPLNPTKEESEATLYDCVSMNVYFDSCLMDFFDLLQLVKFLRFSTLLQYVNNFTKRHKLRFFYMKIFKLFCFMFFTFHCCTCLQFLFERLHHGTHGESNPDSDLWGEQQGIWSTKYASELYLHSLYRTFAFVGGFGLEIASKLHGNVGTQVSIFTFCLIGFIIRTYIIAQVYMLVQIIYSSSMTFQQNRYQLMDYMSSKQLPTNIQARLLNYYDFRLQKQLYKESEVNEIMGPKLSAEVKFEQTKSLLKQVSFIIMMPNELLAQISAVLKTEIYLKDDVVVNGGEREEAMYFVYSGTLAVYHHETGQELKHFEDGAYFGELSLFKQPEITHRTVAIETTEVYFLDVEDFLRIMKPHPELFERAKNIAISKLNVNEIIEMLIENVIPAAATSPSQVSPSISSVFY